MKLSDEHAADLTEPALREYATTKLAAKRCRPEYLTALRCVLGCMRAADRRGEALHLGTVVGFASKATMKTLAGQFVAAGVAVKTPTSRGRFRHESAVYLPPGVVSDPGAASSPKRTGGGRWMAEDSPHAAANYVARQRAQEDRDEARMIAAGRQCVEVVADGIEPEDVPY